MEDREWIESEKGFIDNMQDKSLKRQLEEIKELLRKLNDKLDDEKGEKE